MFFTTPFVVLLASLPAFGLATLVGFGPKATTTAKASISNKPALSSSKVSSVDAAATAFAMTPSDVQIQMAVSLWMNDTGKVSKFLNTATSFTGDEFTRQAQIATNAEIDELNHKAVLDAAFSNTKSVQSANDTLVTKGTFQAVVDALQSMVDNGPDTAQATVDAINTNRCVNVLPNIDAYFAAAGSDMQSIRPTGCLELEAANVSASPSSSGSASSSTSSSTASSKSVVTTAAQCTDAATESSSTKSTTSASAATTANASSSTVKTSAAPESVKASASATKTNSAAPKASKAQGFQDRVYWHGAISVVLA